ncbi:tRNA 2-selenouridine(34) synthase MnmH [Alkalibaculum sp. M08DMB]|uniref:tRNA 2-selenouridine(34) synthase MnmH n=2 Tax=Alkalibaculum sporogenes TaxID=2655001 RepID=A0A6A7K8S5_9FIRM|nr:tRNA 2-selenouridine(34) synthase MnmH [Alkalibaculum sporogenes]
MCNETFEDFHQIVMNKIPLIDVRAPIEYNKGAFKNAINLPLMNNEDRHEVGICYKEKGNEEAVKLGHRLVSGKTKESRIEAWVSYLTLYPESLLYCFRGGQRSQISQQWILDNTGIVIPRLKGGYKSFRNYLIDALRPAAQKSKPIILGGYTGSGKTILLKKLKNSIDLEDIANHRGSSFGKFTSPQPTQINFENNLAYALIQHKSSEYRHMILEDEGRNIGKCFFPKDLAEHFNSGPVIVLEAPLQERIKLTLDEYVLQAQSQFLEIFGHDTGLEKWHLSISKSINKIKKRLGLERYSAVVTALNSAYADQLNTGKHDKHNAWIKILLQGYYDPMYLHQLEKKSNKIAFKGNALEVLQYLNNYL